MSYKAQWLQAVAKEEKLAEACAQAADLLMCDTDNDDPCTDPDNPTAPEDYCNPCSVRADLWNVLDETGHDCIPRLLRAMLGPDKGATS